MQTLFILRARSRCADFARVHVSPEGEGGVCEALQGAEGRELCGKEIGFEGLFEGLGGGFAAFGDVGGGVGVRGRAVGFDFEVFPLVRV